MSVEKLHPDQVEALTAARHWQDKPTDEEILTVSKAIELARGHDKWKKIGVLIQRLRLKRGIGEAPAAATFKHLWLLKCVEFVRIGDDEFVCLNKRPSLRPGRGGDLPHEQLEELNREIPAIDDGSEDWISSKAAAKLKRVEAATWTNKRSAGEKAKDKAYGLHDGCFWRKRGNEHPKYHLPTLKKTLEKDT